MSYNAGVIKIDDGQIMSLLNINETGLNIFASVYINDHDHAAWIKNSSNGKVYVFTANSNKRSIRATIDALPFI